MSFKFENKIKLKEKQFIEEKIEKNIKTNE